MRKTLVASLIAAAFVLPATSYADSPFSGNVALTSDYIFRGIDQSNGHPAIQGGFDYANPNGLYVGTWGSSISWLNDGQSKVSAPLELDIYGGYRNSFAGGAVSYDVGVLTYNYPGTYPSGFVSPDTTELYGSLGYKWLTLKYSTVVSSHIFGFATPSGGDTRGSGYIDLSGSYDLGNSWGVSAHVGHQTIKGYSDASYTDWNVGVSKDTSYGTFSLLYTDTNAKSCGNATPTYCNAFNRDLGRGVAVLTFSKSL